MSATGQGGVSLITGSNHAVLAPVSIPAASTLTFTHGLDRRAFSVLVTSGAAANYGQVITGADGVTVAQPQDGVSGRYDTIVVSNTDPVDGVTVFVSCRWEEPSLELDLVAAGDARVEVAPIPQVI